MKEIQIANQVNMPGVSGKMIRRRLDKSEKERLSRNALSQTHCSDASSHTYARVPTHDKHIESVEQACQSEISPRGVVRKMIQRDLSAINEENSYPIPASVTSTSPIQKAFDFCKSMRRLALHSS